MNWLQLTDDILLQEIDDEMIVLNLSTEEYFALNTTARRFLDLCRASASFDDAINRIVAEYDVPEETARQDLSAFVEQMVRRSIVRVHQPSSNVLPGATVG